MSSAFSGMGTEFARLTTSVYVTIAEIISYGGPNLTRDTIDVTNMDSTSGYREFIGGLRDGGEVTFEMNFLRSTFETLKDDLEDDTVQDYEIRLPDDEKTSFEFSGLVTSLGTTIPNDDKVSASVTIKITGVVTENSGSG